jgi:hypothetical protein
MIPASYTKGKREIRIRLEPTGQGGLTNWNESSYQVWSLVEPST